MSAMSMRGSAINPWWFCALLALLSPACRSSPPAAPAADSPSASQRLEERFPQVFTDRHYGLYLFGEKAGFASTRTRRDPLDGEIHREFLMEMTTEADGVVSNASYAMRSIYSSQAPHALLFSEEVSNEDGGEERKVFNARGPVGRLGVFAGGESHVREGVSTQEALAAVLEAESDAARGGVGTRIRFSEFDIDRQVDEIRTIEFVGRETVDVAGVPRELLHLREVSDEANDAEDTFLDENEAPVLIRIGEIVEARLEDEATARSGAAAVEVLVAGSVPVDGPAVDPAGLSRLELEWSGAARLLPERAGQRSHWTVEGQDQRVELTLAAPPTSEQRAEPLPEEVRRELEADSLCNSDHPRIRALAQEIVGQERDPWRRVELAVDWLQKNVESGYDANHMTALAVLASRRGDCTEFSVLASGLLRALEIPTRRVGGVVLVAEAPDALQGHAWIEVWIGGWIAVDPTFGQVPADCGHVCFGGESDVDFIGVRSMRARIVGSVERGR